MNFILLVEYENSIEIQILGIDLDQTLIERAKTKIINTKYENHLRFEQVPHNYSSLSQLFT